MNLAFRVRESFFKSYFSIHNSIWFDSTPEHTHIPWNLMVGTWNSFYTFRFRVTFLHFPGGIYNHSVPFLWINFVEFDPGIWWFFKVGITWAAFWMAQRWHTDSWFLGCISSLWRNSTRHGKGQTAILAPLITKNLEKTTWKKCSVQKWNLNGRLFFLREWLAFPCCVGFCHRSHVLTKSMNASLWRSLFVAKAHAHCGAALSCWHWDSTRM